MSEGLAAVLVEAFSDTPGAGNGAAVVRLTRPLADRWLQAIASSLRQSETAFLWQSGDRWLLRWFTPCQEVPLCGHATLAAVLALGRWGCLEAGHRLALHSRSGPLEVALNGCADGWSSGSGCLTLPGGGMVPAAIPGDLEDLLQRRGLGVASGFWQSRLGYSVVLVSAAAPLERLGGLGEELGEHGRQGLVVMQACEAMPLRPAVPRLGGEPADYQLRFFAPGLGIPEDPVTGSAHALVAPWWMNRLGRSRVVGWQCSDRPGGMVCEAASSATIRLTGSGHLLWDGTLFARPGSGDADSAATRLWQEACGV